MEKLDRNIIEEFSQWTAFPGTRSGSPEVYPLIRLPKYDRVLGGNSPISQKEFMDWHKTNWELIAEKKMEKRIPYRLG